MTDDIERDFHEAMVNIYREGTKLNYRAKFFLDMVIQYGGVGAAKRLLSQPDEQYGFTKLWELGRLDLTVEAHVIKEPWSALFTEQEIEEARRRLQDHDYNPS